MKMDPFKKGLPQSPVKPPLLPKPKYVSTKPHPHLWSHCKSHVQEKISSTSKHNESVNSFTENLFLPRNSDSSFTPSLDNTNLQCQSEEEFYSFERSISLSTESSLIFDSSSASFISNDEFKECYNINSHELRNNDVPNEDFSIHSIMKEKVLPNTSKNCDSSHNFTADFLNKKISRSSDAPESPSVVLERSNSDDISTDESPKENKAYLIAKELMTSEQIYVDALKLLVIVFKSFLFEYNAKYNTNVIPHHELEKIFNTLPQLLHLNEDLLIDLRDRIDNWHGRRRIADVVVRKGPFLKLYTTYMKDFETQCNYMDECCLKYPKFSKALREFEMSSVCKNLTLKHYMLKPVQRIPHYRLLLEDYLNHLTSDSKEYHDTEVALQIVKDVLHHANSSLKLADNFCKLLQIQGSLGNYEIIKPGRLFIKEGELKKLSRKEIQHRFIILLSDCFLYTIYTASAGLKVKYELPLAGMKVHTNAGDGTDFSIITSTRSFTLRAKNDHECNEWVNTLRRTINDNINRQLTFLNKSCNTPNSSNFESLKLGREAPVWVQDKSTTMCQVCTAEFTVTFRRHHCRCCGKVVCADCSSNKAPLQYLKFQAARVCEDCYKYLLKEFEDPQTNMSDVVRNELDLLEHNLEVAVDNIRGAFKKMDSVKKNKKYVPQRLKEVMANDSGSSMSGWLCRKNKKEWKRLWFVLKEQVLYMYKASHDVVAYDSLPVLGYIVDRPEEEEDMDNNFVFRLTHAGQIPVIFSAPNKQLADLWVAALNEATVLK